MSARKRIEGGLVAGVEELGTRPLEHALQDGGEHGTPRGRDQEQYGREFPASSVEDSYGHGQKRQNDPVVTERRDEAHRPFEPAGEGRVDPEQDGPVEGAALALDDLVGQLDERPDDEGRGGQPRRKPGRGYHRQAVREPPDHLSSALEHGKILARFGTLAARIISVADVRSERRRSEQLAEQRHRPGARDDSDAHGDQRRSVLPRARLPAGRRVGGRLGTPGDRGRRPEDAAPRRRDDGRSDKGPRRRQDAPTPRRPDGRDTRRPRRDDPSAQRRTAYGRAPVEGARRHERRGAGRGGGGPDLLSQRLREKERGEDRAGRKDVQRDRAPDAAGRSDLSRGPDPLVRPVASGNTEGRGRRIVAPHEGDHRRHRHRRRERGSRRAGRRLRRGPFRRRGARPRSQEGLYP